MVQHVLASLNGRKTYAAAVGLGLLAVAQLGAGNHAEAWRALMHAVAIAGLRHAITKAAEPEPAAMRAYPADVVDRAG